MSVVDRYLDELFDRLAGTGAAGRRMLAEAEEHLRAAVADGVARGMSQEQAAHDSVSRFGTPARVARQLRRTHRGVRLNSMFSGAWLLAGLALGALGLSYLAKAVGMAVLLRLRPHEDLPPCPPPPARSTATGPVFIGDCSNTVAMTGWIAIAGLVLLIVGAATLIGRRLAVRRAGLAPTPRRFHWIAAPLFVLAGLALSTAQNGSFGIPGPDDGPGMDLPVIAAGVAMVTSIAVTLWGVVRSGRPRYVLR